MPRIPSAGESLIESLKHHYIITDEKGKVDCISESLAQETGLHSQFFKTTDQLQGSMSIEDLFNSDMVTPEAQDEL